MRVVFLGTGKIARVHARRLRAYRDVELAFASRELARAEAIARELGGAAYPSYEAALAASDVDVVAIVTPPDSHQALALAALAAGKHVVLEKPAFLRAADADAVAEAAARAGRRVFVAENYHYQPVLGRLRALLAERVIGDVVFIHVNAIRKQVTPGWRGTYGALYEGGVHWIDFMTKLGEVTDVHGHAPGRPAGQAERSMLVTFQYEGGAVGTVSYSWEVPATAKGLRLSKIYGRAGSITFETNGLWVLCHGTRTRLYVPGLRDVSGYTAMWRDFVQAWRDDRDAGMTLADARRDLALVERAYATADIDPPPHLEPSSSI
ncbi:MAG TPA: Gfo/Idh/MocA family oxidoreductase [Kofleriaceae bacterium]|nr:Gfo/Idh/MocA family oxidoreductase [Kofleriaceae bacterium]